jgi:hypothetical protein
MASCCDVSIHIQLLYWMKNISTTLNIYAQAFQSTSNYLIGWKEHVPDLTNAPWTVSIHIQLIYWMNLSSSSVRSKVIDVSILIQLLYRMKEGSAALPAAFSLFQSASNYLIGWKTSDSLNRSSRTFQSTSNYLFGWKKQWRCPAKPSSGFNPHPIK